MNLNETLDFFEEQLKKATKKSEKRTCTKFITVLSNLKDRGLTTEDYQLIDARLANLNFEENSNRNFKKQLSIFLKFLKEDFSFITKGYYTEIGVAAGLLTGSVLGSVWEIGMAISLGMLFGLLIGKYMDDQANKENKVLKTEL